MELDKGNFIFINLVCRVVLLVGLLSEQEVVQFPEKGDPLLNWNLPLCDRLVLILANGLRDDFLEQEATPYLKAISEEVGSFAKVKIDGILDGNAALKTLVTGLPAHSSVFFWNRPEVYRTVFDFHSCKCVYGTLPLERKPDCYVAGRSQSEAFRLLENSTGLRTQRECFYVLSFDFDGFNESEYKKKLSRLDSDVNRLVEFLKVKWQQYSTVFMLTSARGWSMWNRTKGTPDVPLLIWGNGILHMENEEYLRLADVPVLVNTLVGVSFPPGAMGHVPTYFLNVTSDMKYHIILYNLEHLRTTLGIAAEEEIEFEKTDPDDSEIVDILHESVRILLEDLNALRQPRADLASIATLAWLVLTGPLHLALVVRETLTINHWTTLATVSAALATFFLVTSIVVQCILLALLVTLLLCVVDSVAAALKREGFRAYLFALAGTVLTISSIFFGRFLIIFFLSSATLFWPVLSQLHRRVNRRILGLWVFSHVLLMFLPFFPVIGRTPIRNLVNLGVLFNLGLFLSVFRSFKLSLDFHTRIVIIALIFSVMAAPFFVAIFGISASVYSCLLSWMFLFYSVWWVRYLGGTLLERFLKYFLAFLIPFHLLSIRHESFSYLGLTGLMLSWLFMENFSQRSFLSYYPSVFGIHKPAELSSDGLETKHYRQVFFFMFFCFLSFFAVGNVPSVYTYDVNIARPFGGLFPGALIALKFLLPFVMLVISFIILNFLQGRDPAPSFLLALYFSDVIGGCLLFFAFLRFDFLDIDTSHFIIHQVITVAITFLYIIGRMFL